MKKHEIIEYIHVCLEDPIEKSNVDLTALGMICADIEEFGFEKWIHLSPQEIVQMHIDATSDVADDTLEDLAAIISQEKELDVLGIDQSMRVEIMPAMISFKNGMIEVMRSLERYFEMQQTSKQMFYE